MEIPFFFSWPYFFVIFLLIFVGKKPKLKVLFGPYFESNKGKSRVANKKYNTTMKKSFIFEAKVLSNKESKQYREMSDNLHLCIIVLFIDKFYNTLLCCLLGYLPYFLMKISRNIRNLLNNFIF